MSSRVPVIACHGVVDGDSSPVRSCCTAWMSTGNCLAHNFRASGKSQQLRREEKWMFVMPLLTRSAQFVIEAGQATLDLIAADFNYFVSFEHKSRVHCAVSEPKRLAGNIHELEK